MKIMFYVAGKIATFHVLQVFVSTPIPRQLAALQSRRSHLHRGLPRQSSVGTWIA